MLFGLLVVRAYAGHLHSTYTRVRLSVTVNCTSAAGMPAFHFNAGTRQASFGHTQAWPHSVVVQNRMVELPMVVTTWVSCPQKVQETPPSVIVEERWSLCRAMAVR